MKRRKFIDSSAKTLFSLGILPVFMNGKQKVAETGPEKIEPINAPFDMPQLQRPVFPDRIFDIRDYGATGDGTTKNTNAFQKCISACFVSGGGKVLVPPGKWFTGAIHLKSNVNLHLQTGAEIHFSDKPDDYLPVVFTRWAGFELMNYSPLIYAFNCENIAVTGEGKLFGHGNSWWIWKQREDGTQGIGEKIHREMVLKNIPPAERIFGIPEIGLRPQFINPVRCTNVLLEGFTIEQPGPFWTIHFYSCENVIVRKLTLHTKGGPNNDGINLDSTRNALIEHCVIDAEDDTICLKSGINEDGWRVGKPTENVVVRHVTSLQGHGGIVIGSEMSGDIRNVLAHDCFFDGTDRGIRLKSNSSRGGRVENIWYSNIRMRNIQLEAININTDYASWLADKNGKAHPVFRNLNFENITCENALVAASVTGKMERPIENLMIKNLSVNAEKGLSFLWVDGLKFVNLKAEIASGEPTQILDCTHVEFKP
jgi:polygalacturonase